MQIKKSVDRNIYILLSTLIILYLTSAFFEFKILFFGSILSTVLSRIFTIIVLRDGRIRTGKFLFSLLIDFSFATYLLNLSQQFYIEREIRLDVDIILVLTFLLAHIFNAVASLQEKKVAKYFSGNKKNFSLKSNFTKFKYSLSSNNYIFIFVSSSILVILTALLTQQLGILSLGKETVALPFGIGGIINYFLLYISQFIFIFLINISLLNEKLRKFVFPSIILTFITYLVVTILINSRGFFFDPIQRIIILFFFYSPFYVFIIKRILILASTLLLPLTILLTYFRDGVDSQISFDFILAFFSHILGRIFSAFLILRKYLIFTDKKIPFNEIIESGNFANYHTYQIDRIPEWVIHKSGSTTLGDFYLLFGYLGVIFSLIIITLIFNYLIGKHNIYLSLPIPVCVALDSILISFFMEASILEFFIFRFKNIVVTGFLFFIFFTLYRTSLIKNIFNTR